MGSRWEGLDSCLCSASAEPVDLHVIGREEPPPRARADVNVVAYGGLRHSAGTQCQPNFNLVSFSETPIVRRRWYLAGADQAQEAHSRKEYIYMKACDPSIHHPLPPLIPLHSVVEPRQHTPSIFFGQEWLVNTPLYSNAGCGPPRTPPRKFLSFDGTSCMRLMPSFTLQNFLWRRNESAPQGRAAARHRRAQRHRLGERVRLGGARGQP